MRHSAVGDDDARAPTSAGVRRATGYCAHPRIARIHFRVRLFIPIQREVALKTLQAIRRGSGLVLLLGLCACYPDKIVEPTSISMDSEASIEVGATLNLAAKITGEAEVITAGV